MLWLLDVNMAAMQVGLEWMTGCGGDRDFSVVAAGVEASLAEGECGWRAEVRQRREEGVMVLLSGDGCPSHKAHECVVCHTLFVSGSGGDPSSKGLTRLESRQWRVHQWVLENYLCRWVVIVCLFDFLHGKRKKKYELWLTCVCACVAGKSTSCWPARRTGKTTACSWSRRRVLRKGRAGDGWGTWVALRPSPPLLDNWPTTWCTVFCWTAHLTWRMRSWVG